MNRCLTPSLFAYVLGGTLCLLPSWANAQEAGIEWRYSYATARQEAQEKGRPLVLEFGRKVCPWCDKLDHDTLSHPTIVKTINDNFIPLKIDGDLEPKLVDHLQIQAYPTVILADADGKILGTMEGFKD